LASLREIDGKRLDFPEACPKQDGATMKKKNEIPDFSKKKKKDSPQHGVPDPNAVQQHAPNPPVRTGKPPATSMKSGRRGS
jgi:hypothetical protein